jgi:adenylate cyclase
LLGTSKSSQDSIEKAIELVQQVIAQADGLAAGHSLLGWLYAYKREYDKALAEAERAMALNPSGADTYAWYGVVLTYACRPEEAVPIFQKALRLNPFAPAWYYLNFGVNLMNMGRFEEAVSACGKALQRAPDSITPHVYLTATYSMMGREKEARVEAGEVLRVNPKFSLDTWARARSFYKDQSVVENIIVALRKAGLK